MVRALHCLTWLAIALSWVPSAAAQTFDTVGTRAAGMGGAFVAIADDASAAYWNPGGFAAGNFFTMVVDRSTTKADPGRPDGAWQGDGLLVSLGMPALGLSYYRLHAAVLTPAVLPTQSALAPAGVRVDTLVTHHSGVTLVQSIVRGVAIGTTLKVVRGVAGSVLRVDRDRDDLLRGDNGPTGKGTSKFDADVGVMATAGTLKAGLTVRNVTEPAFPTGSDGRALSLDRQVRAGVAVAVAEGWAVAADLDLTQGRGPDGPVRQFATGTEGRIGRKAFLRGGLRLSTSGSANPAASAGASYAVMGSVLIDAHLTAGADEASRGWGVAARFVY
jgi:hypothetical protein